MGRRGGVTVTLTRFRLEADTVPPGPEFTPMLGLATTAQMLHSLDLLDQDAQLAVVNSAAFHAEGPAGFIPYTPETLHHFFDSPAGSTLNRKTPQATARALDRLAHPRNPRSF